jgi:hypothetical protein
MVIHVVGGFYKEYCTRPAWDETYGSGGRAAVAIAAMGTATVLHTYVSPQSKHHLDALGQIYSVQIRATHIEKPVRFEYLHNLARPDIFDTPESSAPNLSVKEKHVVRFGMLEGDAIVDAEWAVYDPQNQGAPVTFAQNGSKATHLALVLNQWESQQMAQLPTGSAAECACKIASEQQAEVVIIKQGAQGALVWAQGRASQIPAFRTNKVWKIGSGDCFVAYFAQAWMGQGMAPVPAAELASRATAYYCETRGFSTPSSLNQYQPPAIKARADGGEAVRRSVYLAGPFFYLAQIWLIEESRIQLKSSGLAVFSPFHDVGLGSADDVVQKDIDAIKKCDVMFAIADGLDAGTMFEIGYARSIGMPVVIYSEVEQGAESLKMMEGTGCEIYADYATALYATRWKAIEL